MKKIVLLSLVLALSVSAAAAEGPDGVATDGQLSDEDFFRGVTCGAIPGGECRQPVVRWPPPRAATLTLSVSDRSGGMSDRTRALAEAALEQAIAAVSGVGATLRITRLPDGQPADLPVYFGPFSMGERISDVDPAVDGSHIEAGFSGYSWNEDEEITSAVVMIAADIDAVDIRSVMLEEILQALGFGFDIENPQYDNVSIFSQGSNTVTTIEGQDAMALRMLYGAGQ